MSRGFRWILLLALGTQLSLVMAIVGAQLAYTGSGAPLRTLGDPDVGRAVGLSFFVSVSAAFGAAVFAVPAGYALSRWRFRGKSLLEGFLMVPVLMSPMALGVSLLLVFRMPAGQWIEDHLLRFVFELPGMILAQFLVAVSLETLVVRTTFDGMGRRYEDVARCLGCSPWAAFRRVALPMARSGIAAAVVLGWARAIGDFGATSMIAGAVRGKTETMPVSIYLSMASVSLDRAVCLSLILTLVTIVSLVLVERLMRGRRAS